ncbi:MAG: winged helix DNA-binding protein [Oscillospiraceae bacterium]|jgi:DNA-binding MarR family transcriptional regulator|nr:winged helix DNA-binding protein [Oscillospiraceae bacterium]
MDFQEQARQLMQMLATAHNGPTDQLHRLIKGEAFVLHYLAQREKAALPGELRDASETSSARIAATLHSLEQKGFVTRETDPGDRRRVLVHITEAGRSAIRRRRAKTEDSLTEVLRALGEEDAQTFLRLLERVLALAAEQTLCKNFCWDKEITGI